MIWQSGLRSLCPIIEGTVWLFVAKWSSLFLLDTTIKEAERDMDFAFGFLKGHTEYIIKPSEVSKPLNHQV